MIPVEQITLTHIEMPLVTPFETSFGRDLTREAVVVELRTPDGSGWAETVAFGNPGYSYETVDTCWSILSRYLVPAMLAAPLPDPGVGAEAALGALHSRWTWVRG